MEEKENSLSGSLLNSETDSPPVSGAGQMPPVINIPGGSGESFGKKKRGRPKKYDSDGKLRLANAGQSPFSSPELSSKRGKGRPPGTGNWQMLASLGGKFAGTAGRDFIPHVVNVIAGEDVAETIISLAQMGPRGICVLSANGSVSNFTLRQPGSSGGILTYEGRFELLNLSGSFAVTDSDVVRSQTAGLSVALAGPDGRVIGGRIAGSLIAASPIQMVIGSFVPNGYKAHRRKHYHEHSSASIIPGPSDVVANAEPISEIKPGESRFAAASQLTGQSHREAGAGPSKIPIPNSTLSHNAGWNRSDAASHRRPSPDINLSVPFE